ncbi:MAG: IS110 family transposase [Bacteroidetes bacterium]|jgi:transposase|nr:IS110 family transposase [Bacteroidota bacterium]MBP6314160.1 IS110 family transposase [Chitinophagaceae bacterium]
MKKFKIVIGIDISKNKLDVCIIEDPTSKQRNYFIVSNDKKGIDDIFKELKKYKVSDSELVFCFENTGVYGMHLCYALQQRNVSYSMVPAIEIKRARGLTRGKSDKTDSLDIALYAITHEHKLSYRKLPEYDLMKLRLLLTEREKLIKSISLFDSTKENEDFLPKEITRNILKINKQTIIALKKQLLAVEKNILTIIKENETIKQQYALATSVPGVGQQTAINLLVATRCFSTFENWRQLACYAGVAPFKYASGTSVHGKTKVSHMANKKLKSLLNMAALSAKKHDKQLKEYYERKIREGKNGMSVMNALRCKIISRVFAAIKRETPYVDFLKYST